MPKISGDEILVKVAATSFNAADGYIRAGLLGRVAFPFIPHVDFSGIVAEIGTANRKWEIGDRVMGAFIPSLFNGAAAAEYVAVNPKQIPVSHVPKNMILADCAAVPAAALTAYQGISCLCDVKADDRVAVIGGAGGVGSFAVQFAKARGARVISGVSRDSMAQVISLGADAVYDYRADALAHHAKPKFDAVFNTAPIAAEEVTVFLDSIRQGGCLVSTLNGADKMAAEKLKVKSKVMAVRSDSDQLRDIAVMIESGIIRPYITAHYTLDDIGRAHRDAVTAHGKIVIVVNGDI